jgi:hypothetical protein
MGRGTEDGSADAQRAVSRVVRRGHRRSRDRQNREKRAKMHHVQAAVKVRVEHGQLVVDEPATLPEGSRWKLVPLDILEEEMGPEEHAEFLRELEISAKEAEAGELIDAEDVLAKLRATAYPAPRHTTTD